MMVLSSIAVPRFRIVTVTRAPPALPALDAEVATDFTYFVLDVLDTSQPQPLSGMTALEAADWITSVMGVRHADPARMPSDTLAPLAEPWQVGKAADAKIPMTATMIISSIRVKPCWPVLRERERERERFIIKNPLKVKSYERKESLRALKGPSNCHACINDRVISCLMS